MQIIAKFIFILSVIMPIIYDIVFIKKLKYSYFLIFILLYLLVLSYYFDNIVGEPLGGFIYGLSAVFVLYLYSLILLIKIFIILLKKWTGKK